MQRCINILIMDRSKIHRFLLLVHQHSSSAAGVFAHAFFFHRAVNLSPLKTPLLYLIMIPSPVYQWKVPYRWFLSILKLSRTFLTSFLIRLKYIACVKFRKIALIYQQMSYKLTYGSDTNNRPHPLWLCHVGTDWRGIFHMTDLNLHPHPCFQTGSVAGCVRRFK